MYFTSDAWVMTCHWFLDKTDALVVNMSLYKKTFVMILLLLHSCILCFCRIEAWRALPAGRAVFVAQTCLVCGGPPTPLRSTYQSFTLSILFQRASSLITATSLPFHWRVVVVLGFGIQGISFEYQQKIWNNFVFHLLLAVVFALPVVAIGAKIAKASEQDKRHLSCPFNHNNELEIMTYWMFKFSYSQH